MNKFPDRTFYGTLVAGAALLALAGWVIHDGSILAQDVPPPPPAPPSAADSTPQPVESPTAANDPNVEVLTRGPVHEAYALPVGNGATPGLAVGKCPPDPIDEQAPDIKPEGDAAAWIPGYWSWDDDRKDFIWVSGVWRVPPPGYNWVSGYWQKDAAGCRWVSGFWTRAANAEVEYLPQPPASVELGPTSPTPGPTYFWIPGHWHWRLMHYAWVPGYWSASQPGWVWVQPSYCWCPRGWVYCDGYWDYPLERRGLLFSPVRLAGRVRFYRPAVCVDLGFLTFSLFCRPAYCHYYFGDYYADSYAAVGIYPWFSFSGPRYGYDPLFSYYRAYYLRHDGNGRWEASIRGWHDYYHAHPAMRPPHTSPAQQRLLADPMARKRPDFQKLAIGETVAAKLRNNPNSLVKVQAVTLNQRTVIQQSAKQMSSFRSERFRMEAKGSAGNLARPAGTAVGPAKPEKANLATLPGFHDAAGQSPGTGTASPGTVPPRKTGTPFAPPGIPATAPGNSGRVVGPSKWNSGRLYPARPLLHSLPAAHRQPRAEPLNPG